MVAAAVVGEVLLRGGEAGSVVPTKVPGNLERGDISAGSCVPVGVPRAPPNTWAHCHRGKETPATYMAPWELAA